MKITRDTLVIDILYNICGAVDFFNSLNMNCSHCSYIDNETLERACMMHGYDCNVILDQIRSLQLK